MSSLLNASPRPRLPLAAAVWSLACTALGLWWLLEPAAYVLDDYDVQPSLATVLPARAGAWLLLVAGLAGVAVGVLLAADRAGSAGRRALVAVGAVLAVFFGVAVPDLQLLSFLGYALALFGGPVLVAILLVGARRHARNLLVVVLLAAAVGVGVAAGEIGEPTLRMLADIRDAVVRIGLRPLVLAFLLAGGLLFTATMLTAVRRPATDPGGRTPDDRTRSAERLQVWGHRATVVAALCPLPYGLVRMTWLTPWPQGLPRGTEAALDGGVRVFGICLGLAALGGAWLTLGLISRWGEVWPVWLPALRGRPVPVGAAVAPAALVSLVLCASSVSLIAMSVADGSPWLALVIPAPIWGPALGLATYAYYRRRTDDARAEAPAHRTAPHQRIGA